MSMIQKVFLKKMKMCIRDRIIGASLVVAIPKLIGVAMGINSLDIYAEKEGFLHILYLLEQVGWTGIGLVNTVLGLSLIHI